MYYKCIGIKLSQIILNYQDDLKVLQSFKKSQSWNNTNNRPLQIATVNGLPALVPAVQVDYFVAVMKLHESRTKI